MGMMMDYMKGSMTGPDKNYRTNKDLSCLMPGPKEY